jgi:hypothetical protein
LSRIRSLHLPINSPILPKLALSTASSLKGTTHA